MRLNRWANVVCWEPRPRWCLHTSEVVWQVAHRPCHQADAAALVRRVHGSEHRGRRLAGADCHPDVAQTSPFALDHGHVAGWAGPCRPVRVARSSCRWGCPWARPSAAPRRPSRRTAAPDTAQRAPRHWARTPTGRDEPMLGVATTLITPAGAALVNLREEQQNHAWLSCTTPFQRKDSSTYPASPSRRSGAFHHRSRPFPSNAYLPPLSPHWQYFHGARTHMVHPVGYMSLSS